MTRNLSELLPHKFPMLLIDEIVSFEAAKLIARVQINERSLGLENSSVPSWFGVEYMAQAICAYNSLMCVESGEPEIGFLAGVRGYNTEIENFPLGALLDIVVVPNLIVENCGSFLCEIHMNKNNICQGVITTFKPDSQLLKKILEGSHE